MDFNFSNNNCINNKINEITPFKLLLSNNNDNLTKNNINNQSNNNKNIINNKILLKQKRYKNSIKEYNQKENNKSNEYMENQDIKIKIFNKKSSNKYIVLNNSIFQKELNLLTQKFGEMNLFKNNIIPIEEEKKKYHCFPFNNNYVSIRKAFADITNNNYMTKKNENNINSFKAKMPKNFEIHKRKINITSFQELINQENNQYLKIIKKKGGCCCKRFKKTTIK